MAKKNDGKIRAVVLLADTHLGSNMAICPRGFETLKQQEIRLNPLQEWFLQSWEKGNQWIDEVMGGDPFAIVHLGDVIEGNHHRTKEIWSPDTTDHVNAAIELLEPLAKKASKFFVVEGTECHTGNKEHSIAKALGAVKPSGKHRHAWDRLSLTVAGTRCVFQHHIVAALRPWTESTGLGTALAMEQIEAARSGEKIPTVLASAHRHKHGVYETTSGLCVVCHPWQALTRFGLKVVPSARTRPGFTILDWRERDDGSNPDVHTFTARPPEDAGVIL